MSTTRTFLLLMVLLTTALTVLGGHSPGHSKTFELTYSIFFPATHGHSLLATEWAKEVEKRTNGAVKINMFPGATLTPADQCYDGVVKGISDIGMSVLSYTKGRFPLSEVIDLPLGYTKGIQVTRLCNAFYDKFKPKEFDDVKVMYLHGHGPGIFHTKKPVEKMEDLKGMKIRCSGTSAKVVAALGATPVAMPQNECYDALQKGVVDGVVSPIETLKGWKFAEVIKSTTQNFGSAYTLGFFVVMNKKKWESLPKEVQQTIEQINKEWIDKTGNGWDSFDEIGTEFTLSKGNKIIPLSKEEDARWAKTVSPVLDEYVAAMKAKGLPGEEALSFCREWLKNNP
ncbi:TRAP transporter substrate-binding protein [Desulfomonile tiedjei]|uniref:TRAP-type C4-dicarboxylate transport system, periplasmic component n=1 Tax=Desulfomonile tiedjei (strain ATCC 49306 / DSM 6799 / DCB-1) TaxID=706587 RepID=I4CC87_DESTA|nr:TRAP transporter substrate-binding protein [Desulfomonile tiedjei]AFM27178.1 TRAP-type C4-dicarboxylate transport system, periplasmic component [Desulfomonile tiedjei DSM 6799]